MNGDYMIRINMRIVNTAISTLVVFAASLYKDLVLESPDVLNMVICIALIVVTSVQSVRLFSNRHLHEPEVTIKGDEYYMVGALFSVLSAIALVLIILNQTSFMLGIATLYIFIISFRQFMSKYESEGIFEDHILVKKRKIFFDDITNSYSSEKGYTVETSVNFLLFSLYTPTELKVDYNQVDYIETLVKKHIKNNLAS